MRMRLAITAANFSPAVASRRSKYDGAFGFPALLGAQPDDHAARASPTRQAQYRHGSRTLGGKETRTRAPTVNLFSLHKASRYKEGASQRALPNPFVSSDGGQM
jgi:hypothetical protein